MTGNLADIEKKFGMSVAVYNGGSEVTDYITTQPSLKHDEAPYTFVIPQGYSYQVQESDSIYNESVAVKATTGGAAISIPDACAANRAVGTPCATGMVTPTEDQTITFTNNLEKAPITGALRESQPFRVMAIVIFGSALILGGFCYVKRFKYKVRDG